MAKIKEPYNKFDFIGSVLLPRKEENILKKEEKEGRFNKVKLSLGVKESDSNSIFPNFEANVPKDEYEIIKKSTNDIVDGKRQNIEFSFKDRNSEVIINQIPDWAKLVVDLETDFEKKSAREKLRFQIMNLESKQKEDGITDSEKEDLTKYKEEYIQKSDNVHMFIHEYDFINFLYENLELIKSHRIRVTGNYRKSVGKQYYTSYQPTKVEFVSSEKVIENDEEGNEVVTDRFKYPSKLEISSMSFYFDKDAIDNQLKKENKVYINGYIKSNVKKGDNYVEGYIPQQFVMDCTHIDLENEKNLALFELVVSAFKCKKTLHNIGVKLRLKNGQEEIEFSEDSLTEWQKKQVKAGLHTVEYFRPTGNIYGKTITEFKFIDFLNIDTYKEGVIDTELKDGEYYVVPLVEQSSNISVEDIKEETTKEEGSAISKLFSGAFGD